LDTGDKVNGLDLAREVPDFSPREHRPPPPPPRGLFERIENSIKKVSNWVTVLAALALIAMLVISVADVIGLKLVPVLGTIFKTGWVPHPIPGAPELIAFLAVLVIAFPLSYTLIERAHIQVDVFVNKFPEKLKNIVEALVSLLGFSLFSMLAWYTVIYGNQLRIAKEVSMTQHIPFYPFIYALAVACIPICLYLLLEFIRGLMNAVKR
jgi:TRAP-type C4-dicarboxylate transport system permease small subunit